MYVTLVITVMAMVAMVTSAPALGVENIDLLMPQVKPQKPDTYLCTAIKVAEKHRYITGFVPNADAHIAHHVLLYGCEEPGAAPGTVWNCGEMESTDVAFSHGPVCQSASNIVYAWAMEAPKLTLPEGVSFDVGQDTELKYLVVQVHYKNVSKFLPPYNGDDSSGITLETTLTPTKKQAGVYLMVTGGMIPPHTIEYFETACSFDEDIEIVPFAFRTHAHILGRVISGYRIRDSEWSEIGRQDPRISEMFYNVTSPGLTVKKGDILAARCTMENGHDHTVNIGATQKDEMCNFYIMHYVTRPPTPAKHSCFRQGPPYWYFNNYENQAMINWKAIPKTASVIPGSENELSRNATYEQFNGETAGSSMEGVDVVDGIPQRFDDIPESGDRQLLGETLGEMDADEVLYLIQQMAQEEEEMEARNRMWQQRQAQRWSHQSSHPDLNY